MGKIQESTMLKYKLTVDEWFNNKFNGAAAWRKFNPDCKKDDAATSAFARMQKNEEVRAYIKQKHEDASKIIEATHEGILLELKNWIQSDITQTIGLTSEEVKQLPIEVKRLITKYKRNVRRYYDKKGNLSETIETIDLHFVSKERAIDMINKHLGFYELDNRQKSNEINIFANNEKHATLIQGILSGE